MRSAVFRSKSSRFLELGAAIRWDEAPVADVLADVAGALRVIDMTWPRNDVDFLDNRARSGPAAATVCPTGRSPPICPDRNATA